MNRAASIRTSRGDDAEQRPALARRRFTQRLDEDPAQEAGRGEREDADQHGVPRLLKMRRR